MKNLFTRTITGAIYVALVVGSILISKYIFAIVFGLILAYSLFEFYRLCKKGGAQPQIIFGILSALYLFGSLFLFRMNVVGVNVFIGVVLLLIISAVVELLYKKEQPLNNIAYTFLGIIYIGLPFSILSYILTPLDICQQQCRPELLLSLFILLWANDSGAYLVGSWLGKTKMIERISPKKTWEGAAGGAIISLIVAIVLFRYIDLFNTFHAIILCLLTVVSGTIGDLTESMIKRSFNIKDSGNIMPGHGGLLDRFDSMLFAAPVYYIYIFLVLN